MNMPKNNEIWVFLSHSNKDYEKVRLVRNLLEEQSLRPLMFFLQCLNDEEEIDALIKREIDCRTRFILCDSENARASHWVQKEVDYIKSKDRICERINLDDNLEEISRTLRRFIDKSRLFISYNRHQVDLAADVYNRLKTYDFSVYYDWFYDKHKTYVQDYRTSLEFLERSVRYGYVICIMDYRILDEVSCARSEVLWGIDKGEGLIPNIIPFVMEDSIMEFLKEDEDLKPLLQCGIRSLEGLSREERCDEIVKEVLVRLMSKGAIMKQAENFSKGIDCVPNEREAEFLLSLLDKF